MQLRKSCQALFAAIFLLALSGCSGQMAAPPASQNMGSVFTIGSDAPPLPSVLSFQVMVNSVTLSDGATQADVLSAPQTIDFARLDGLNQLLDLTSVPTGTYTQVTINLSSPVIGFLDTSGGPGVAPVLNTMAGTLTTGSVTVTLANPLIVDNGNLVGLFLEFDLHQSIQTDSSGNITGTINPTFDARAVEADDAFAFIDDFRGGVVSVNTSDNSFVIQGPHSRQWTVQTNNQTEFDDGESLSSFSQNTIVEVSGVLDPVTHGIDANEVEVLSQDHFFAGGLITFVSPAIPNPATQMDVFVRTELPDLSSTAPIGQIDPFALNGSEQYLVANVRLPITSLLFNQSSLAAGQRVGIGGAIGAGAAPSLTVHRVVLERQGQQGTWVPGSTQVNSGNAGSFQLNDNFLAGVLLPQPVTVITSNATNFVNLSGLSALAGTEPIRLRIVGFILVDPQTGKPVMVAGRVELLTT